MSKVTKNERISTLEDAVAMNWSDMKKIETKISRAMTDMATRISNISLQLEGQQRQIHLAADSIGLNKQAIIMLENEREAEAEAEPEPQLKQLDQSVFDGLDEKWRFAAVDSDGAAFAFVSEPARHGTFWGNSNQSQFTRRSGKGAYNASNWRNSLIERDITKELLGVDLSSELTGSELCKAMLARGDTRIMCKVYDDGNRNDLTHVIRTYSDDKFHTKANRWSHAIPINNQGEPLTAADVGL